MSSQRVKLVEPYIDFDDVESELRDIFDSGQFTRGVNVSRFIKALSEYTGARHAFLTTSATTALSLCLKVLGIGAGDKVAISDFSFPATANVVEDLGAIPVFVDVDRDTYNMSARDLRNKIDSVKAVIFVDAFGCPSSLLEIQQICRAKRIPLVEDAACGLGSSVQGVKVGAIADMTCFSFHPRKLLTTGEGGAITTNNPQYAEALEIKLNHGARGVRGVGADFIDYGYNYRMSEFQALLGWKQLARLDSVIERRQTMMARYMGLLGNHGFARQSVDAGYIHNVQSIVLTVPAGIYRDVLIDRLNTVNIESTLGTYSLSATSYYAKKYQRIQPNSQWLEQNTITLPCHDNVDVGRVCDAIVEFVSGAT
ncbi:DegT/DnrJ/EryC1/StrS family aminotransferase [Motiliproteus sediminis]|uniref:DegT/DnrJ/EryC1/StrS family aminotransferase n=1 Tax=Motiliproteus sediminis TaxID=1468178 RepID=UPI001AEFA42C|nr:DegT/DnrJ/EryC1/StrS aminotransferase family protein [Motiliproteus sediminis]